MRPYLPGILMSRIPVLDGSESRLSQKMEVHGLESKLKALQKFGGMSNTYTEMGRNSSGRPFTTGQTSGKAMRVVIPLFVAKVFFENFDINEYVRSQGCLCIPSKNARALFFGEHRTQWCCHRVIYGRIEQKSSVAPIFGDWCGFKSIELNGNFLGSHRRIPVSLSWKKWIWRRFGKQRPGLFERVA